MLNETLMIFSTNISIGHNNSHIDLHFKKVKHEQTLLKRYPILKMLNTECLSNLNLTITQKP